MADELKPCPDGHKDVYLWESKRAHDGAPQWDVVCGGQDCEWALWGFLDRDSVVRQWNARAAAPADASLIDRLHTAEAEVAILESQVARQTAVAEDSVDRFKRLGEQLALQGAELFALRSFKASVPWPSICDLLWAIDDREPGAMALKLWYDANRPQEATE